jgi:hypothetical protein
VDEIELGEVSRHIAHKQLSHRTGKLELAAPQLLANQAVGYMSITRRSSSHLTSRETSPRTAQVLAQHHLNTRNHPAKL